MSDTENFGYDKLNLTQVREIIANLNKEIMEQVSNKKDLVKSYNETIKDLNSRLKSAVDRLKAAELEEQQAKLEEQVTKLIEDSGARNP